MCIRDSDHPLHRTGGVFDGDERNAGIGTAVSIDIHAGAGKLECIAAASGQFLLRSIAGAGFSGVRRIIPVVMRLASKHLGGLDTHVIAGVEILLIIHGGSAVSYTHLDVYKRQAADRLPAHVQLLCQSILAHAGSLPQHL